MSLADASTQSEISGACISTIASEEGKVCGIARSEGPVKYPEHIHLPVHDSPRPLRENHRVICGGHALTTSWPREGRREREHSPSEDRPSSEPPPRRYWSGSLPHLITMITFRSRTNTEHNRVLFSVWFSVFVSAFCHPTSLSHSEHQ